MHPLVTILGSLCLMAAPVLAQPMVPDTVSGLKLWMDSGSPYVTRNGSDQVSAWASRLESPVVSGVQATMSRQPIWIEEATPSKQAALSFDGTDRLNLDQQIPLTNALTAFVVFSISDLAIDNQYLLDTRMGGTPNPGYSLLYRVIGGAPYLEASYRHPDDSAATRIQLKLADDLTTFGNDGWVIASLQIASDAEGRHLSLSALGNEATDTKTGLFTNLTGAYNLAIGALANNYSDGFLRGEVASILLYDRALGEGEITGVTDYLNQFYVIPEPQTVALLVGGLVILGIRRAQARAGKR